MGVRKTQDQYLKEAQEIHGSKYIYDKTVYTKAHVKVTITCPTHGDFTMNARCHIKPQCCGCPDCAGNSRKTTEQFIREAKESHGDYYDYSPSQYTNAQKKIAIICPVHGVFTQRAKDQLLGIGCYECNIRKGIGQYSEKFFIDFPDMKSSPATLYCMRLTNDTTKEEFWKVGITTRKDTHYRVNEIGKTYVAEVIHEVSGDLYDIWKTEQRLISENKSSRYIPLIKFGGYTECFSTRINLR